MGIDHHHLTVQTPGTVTIGPDGRMKFVGFTFTGKECGWCGQEEAIRLWLLGRLQAQQRAFLGMPQ